MIERIPFPDRIVKWTDIAKGVGQVVVESLFYRHHEEPRPSMSNHNHVPEQQPARIDPEVLQLVMGYAHGSLTYEGFTEQLDALAAQRSPDDTEAA